MRYSHQPAEPGYLFIDAGHLLKYYSEAIGEWFEGDGEIDFAALKARYEAFKVFYYDCADDLEHSGESREQYQERLAAQELKFDTIGSVIGTHVRRGALVGVNKKKRRQKAVDILLAVDMMTHAVRQNMQRAVLLSGDADFEPLVDSLVQMGMYVAVSGDAKHTSKDLVRAADAFIPLHFQDYFDLSTETLRANHPAPYERRVNYPDEGFYEGTLVAQGETEDGRLITISFPNVYRAYVPLAGAPYADTFDYKDAEKLKLYIKLRFGSVEWAR
jgi:uncharacterized LabA/DUF88 family protein